MVTTQCFHIFDVLPCESLDGPEGQNPASGEKLQEEQCEVTTQREIQIIRAVSEGCERTFTAIFLALIGAED